jgi:hypothetical protein
LLMERSSSELTSVMKQHIVILVDRSQFCCAMALQYIDRASENQTKRHTGAKCTMHGSWAIEFQSAHTTTTQIWR